MSDSEMKEIIADALKKLAESEARRDEAMAASKAEMDKVMAASKAETDKAIKEMTAAVGGLGGRIGVIVELLLIPGICKEINKYGHNFVLVCPNANIRKDKLHTQVDVMLYDTTEAMAIEIKTHLDTEDVEWHIHKRLTALRELENEFNIKNKALYGAAAAVSIDGRARKLALENGLYIIEMRENEKIPLIVEAPVNNKPKIW